MQRRLLIAALVAISTLALLAPAVATAAAASTGPPVPVAALVRQPDGSLAVHRTAARDKAGAQALAGRLRNQAGVVAADVATRVRALQVPQADPMQPQQWGLGAVQAPRAWESGDASSQVVAVVDTGVDLSHPDLSGALVPGFDELSGSAGGQDQNGHGTHIAGIIAAVAGNGVGGAGVALRAKIMPVRVLDATGSGSSSDVAAGVIWAVDHGATVVNLSLGSPTDDAVLDQAIAYALQKRVPVVAAAGNEGQAGSPIQYPAATPGVIAVAAVDSSNTRAPFSNTGSYVALSAPGVGIVSTWLGGGYSTASGTSMAAPFVSGAAAMVRAAAPTLSADAVRNALMSTARDLGPIGTDPSYGAGLVDVAAARAAAAQGQTSVVACPAPMDPQQPVLMCPALVLTR